MFKRTETINIDGRKVYFKPAPHLKTRQEDWHRAYIGIITQLLEDLKDPSQPVALPADPLLSALSCDNLLFETASY